MHSTHINLNDNLQSILFKENFFYFHNNFIMELQNFGNLSKKVSKKFTVIQNNKNIFKINYNKL